MFDDEAGKKRELNIAGKVLSWVAYPVSGFIGYWIAKNHIEHSIFTNLAEEGRLGGIFSQYKKDQQNLDMKMLAAAGDTERKAIRKESKVLRQDYLKNLEGRYKELGLDKLSVKAKEVYDQQRHKALIEGFTALSISLGGFLILANSPFLSHMVEKIKGTDDDEPQKSAQR
ncbi:MAG: hypothetical protein AB7L92_03905 [Alphaproteobacteria bacterium]